MRCQNISGVNKLQNFKSPKIQNIRIPKLQNFKIPRFQNYKIQSTNGFAYSLELLVKAKKDNSKIIEIPSTWIERNDRKSSFKILKWSKDYLRWFFLAIF